MYEDKEMRAVMADFLEESMASDDKIVVLDADLAKANGTYALRERFPGRAIDVGIAEAHMASMAAGLASYGYKPFIFSFCPFVTRRIADQAAISIAYAGMNVKIVGTDPGITAQLNGATHMSVEDVGVMRSIPNMVIFEAADCDQYAKALPQILDYSGPMYIRQIRKLAPASYFGAADYQFDLFRADVLREGTDVTLFASGIEVHEAMTAAEELWEGGIAAEVISIHTIKPLDEQSILRSVAKTGCAVVCENHNVTGGLGSAVAEVLASKLPAPMEFIGIQDRFGEVGTLPYLLKTFQMDGVSIATAARRAMARKGA